MNLQLRRPVVFFDLETTGTNITHDRIVEISMIKVSPDGLRTTYRRLVNPGIAIPAEATAVHHITNEMVASMPTFKQIAREVESQLEGSDLAGFNSNRFDIPMLAEEFGRIGINHDFSKHRFVDVQTIFHKREQRTLVAAYRFYCGKELEGAHSATADTEATLEVLEAQLERYPDLPRDIDGLSDYSCQNHNVDLNGRLVYNDKRQEVINFGKYKGQLAEDVLRRDPGYFSWILQGDFAQDTKNAFIRIKMRSK